MTYKDFQDIIKCDKEKACYFQQKEMAAEWANSIPQIAKWISTVRNKSFWEIVRFVSNRRGVFKNKLHRGEFAEVLLTFCRDAFKENETTKKLVSSMEQCKYISEMKIYEKIPDAHELRILVEHIEDIFDKKAVEMKSAPKEITIVDRLEAYLRSTVNEDSLEMPCYRIRVNPNYGEDIRPRIAVEQFKKKEFLNLSKPSHIDAYECITGVLTLERLQSFLYKYGSRRNMKLYIVSDTGLANDVYSLAVKEDVGYVMVNLQKDMTAESYVLPRSIEDTSLNLHYFRVLQGRGTMDVPLLIYDDGRVTTSLADMLMSHNVTIKNEHMIKAPYLTNEKIDAIADELTYAYVEDALDIIHKLHNRLWFTHNVITPKREKGHSFVEQNKHIEFLSLEVDVFAIAKEKGLKHGYRDLPDGQLGRLDIKNEKAELASEGLNFNEKLRFTMAHELGHFLLHAPIIKNHCVTSFGETESTLSYDILPKTERGWFEHHANRFASALLMPTKLVVVLYTLLHKTFVSDVYGDHSITLYYSPNQRETHDSYNKVVGGMAKIMCVSVKAMELRLKQLGIIKIG